MPTLYLEPDARLRLEWDGVPTQEQMQIAKAIPGARAVQGGYEWGWWDRTAQDIITRLKTSWVPATAPLAGWASSNGFGPEGWTWTNPERTQQVEWLARTPPKPHQLAFKAWRRGAGRDGLWHPGALLEAGLGTGKTLSAIEEMLELLRWRPRARILVICQNSLIQTTWAEQLAQHADDQLPLILLNVPRVKRQQILSQLHLHAWPIVVVHSHEDLHAFGKALANVEWDMIVIDETASFRTAGAKRTGRLTGFQARPLTAPFRLGLSGLPMIKSATDLYPTLRWLGAPTGNKDQFRKRFMEEDFYSGELKLRDAELLRSLLDAWRFQVPKSAVVSIPRSWHYERIPLLPWQRNLYNEVKRELKRRDAEELASTRLEELMALAKVTAGFGADGRYAPSNAKADHLLKILPLFGDDQVIVWVRFREEAIGALRRLPNAVAFTGAQDDEANQTAYRDFTEGRAQFFVSTLSKGARGLNLPMAKHMVYLTRDFNTDFVFQSLERNARISTEHEHLTVTVIEAEATIDQKISEVLGDDAREAARLTALDVKEVLGR